MGGEWVDRIDGTLAVESDLRASAVDAQTQRRDEVASAEFVAIMLIATGEHLPAR
jgi:hypothetical protein